MEASRKRPIGYYPHESGLYTHEIIRIARRLGCNLKQKRPCNFEKDEGILITGTKSRRNTDHAVVLVGGLIFDLSDLTVWEPEEYRKANRAKFGAVLIPV